MGRGYKVAAIALGLMLAWPAVAQAPLQRTQEKSQEVERSLPEHDLPAEEEQPDTAENNQPANNEPSDRSIEVHAPVEPIQHQEEGTGADCKPGTSPKDRDCRDLLAQEGMEDAAWAVFKLTAIEVVAGAIGILLILLTFRETRKATRAAIRAAQAAELSANAAVAIELPLLRPHGPDLLTVDVVPEDGQPYAALVCTTIPTQLSLVDSITVPNLGRTPAMPTGVMMGHFVGPELPPRPRYAAVTTCDETTVIRRDGSVEIGLDSYQIRITEEEQHALRLRQSYLWFFVSINYRDFMDEPCRDRFCWQWDQESRWDDYYFQPDRLAPMEYRRRTRGAIVAPEPKSALRRLLDWLKGSVD